MRGGRLCASCVLAIALATMLPGAASAKTKVLHGDFTPVGVGEQVSQKLRCPAGTRVSGGGAYTTGSGLEDEVSDSYPFDGKDADTKPDDGWKGAVNGGSASQMRAWAICTNAVRLTYRSAPVQPVSFGGQVTVPCGAGQRPVGGGIGVPGKALTSPLKGTVLSSFPMGWQSSVINMTSPAPTAYAICTPSDRVEHSGGSKNLGPGLQGSHSVGCAQGSKVLGGGGTGLHTDQLEIASLLPSDGADANGKPDDGWTMWFNNESASETGSMNSHALCIDG